MSAATPQPPRVRRRVQHPGGGVLMTKQSDRERTNIKKIFERWAHTGTVEQTTAQAVYGDFSNVSDYQHAINMVMAADEDFSRLPSSVRKHVDNDPTKFLAMVLDPARVREVEELGLTEKQLPPQAVLVKMEASAEPTPDATTTPEGTVTTS